MGVFGYNQQSESTLRRFREADPRHFDGQLLPYLYHVQQHHDTAQTVVVMDMHDRTKIRRVQIDVLQHCGRYSKAFINGLIEKLKNKTEKQIVLVIEDSVKKEVCACSVTLEVDEWNSNYKLTFPSESNEQKTRLDPDMQRQSTLAQGALSAYFSEHRHWLPVWDMLRKTISATKIHTKKVLMLHQEDFHRRSLVTVEQLRGIIDDDETFEFISDAMVNRAKWYIVVVIRLRTGTYVVCPVLAADPVPLITTKSILQSESGISLITNKTHLVSYHTPVKLELVKNVTWNELMTRNTDQQVFEALYPNLSGGYHKTSILMLNSGRSVYDDTLPPILLHIDDFNDLEGCENIKQEWVKILKNKRDDQYLVSVLDHRINFWANFLVKVVPLT